MSETSNHTEFDRRPVLLAEDDPDYRAMIADALAADGHTVVACSNGAEAMDYIDRAIDAPCQRGWPSAMITDLRMPVAGGLDLLAYAGFLPTVAMTAFGTAETRREALRLGAHRVFDKPFDLAEMRALINELVDASTVPMDVDPSPPRLLIVDDDREFVASMSDLLVLRTGATVIRAFSGTDALEALAIGGPFDLMVTDHRMPGPSGAQLVAMTRYAGYEGPILILTAFPGAGVERVVKQHDNVRMVSKSAEPGRILAAVFELIDHGRTQRGPGRHLPH